MRLETNSVPGNGASHRSAISTDAELELNLVITEGELCSQLESRPEGRARHDFAVDAMRTGVIAIQQASGRIDSNQVRAEGDRLLERLGQTLGEHQRSMNEQLVGALKNYFDPESGRFNERVDRLIRQDGELEQVLRGQIGADGSTLASTLAAHLGPDSALMQHLDPDAATGVAQSLTKAVESSLMGQRERILREFSLDNKEGALSRLVAELTDEHRKAGTDLKERIDEVVNEFSLDNEESALSRLVRRVERTQKQISSEFSLDAEGSALARMRDELLDVLEKQRQVNEKFQAGVMESLAAMVARKEEARRSTRRGEAFEDEVFEFVQKRSQRAGDVATDTGATTGLIKNCKVGDSVVELGPDHAAAGARIVIEAKDKAGHTLARALEEIEVGRKNRGAAVGLFVFSSDNAPEGLEPLARYGNDVVAVWDVDDPATDVVLIAALEVARALSARIKIQKESQQADFESIDRAIRDIEKQLDGLDEIRRLTGTIESNSKKILKRASIIRRAVADQLSTLDEKADDLREALSNESSVDGEAG